jgi:hypothetical protein
LLEALRPIVAQHLVVDCRTLAASIRHDLVTWLPLDARVRSVTVNGAAAKFESAVTVRR